MDFDITTEHLKPVFFLLNSPLPHPKIFYEDASKFLPIFADFDVKTGYHMKLTTGRSEREASYFGQKIIEFAQQDYITEKGALIPLVTENEELDAESKEQLQHFSTNLFLNLAAWYLIPLIISHGGGICPYMPRSWIENFLKEKEGLVGEQRREYFKNIVGSLVRVSVKAWVMPYSTLIGQLGQLGAESLLLLIGMFREAVDNPVAPATPSSSAARQTPDLGSPITDFIESLDLTDFGKNNEPEEG